MALALKDRQFKYCPVQRMWIFGRYFLFIRHGFLSPQSFWLCLCELKRADSVFLALLIFLAQVPQVWTRTRVNRMTASVHLYLCKLLSSLTYLPPFSLIRDFGKQNTRGNVSKISISLVCYWQPLVWLSSLLCIMLSGCDWWISIRSVNNT